MGWIVPAVAIGACRFTAAFFHDRTACVFTRLCDQRVIADQLEPLIIKGIHEHSKGHVDRAKKEGKLNGILTQLMCEVGEPSLIGAHSANSKRLGKVETFSRMIPLGTLLNPLFTPPRTGTGVELGLEQSVKANLPTVGLLGQSIDEAAYSNAIEKNGQTVGGQPGDAIFPMSAPEKSYADRDAIQELLRQNLVDKDLVTDVMMTDFTVSAFSDVRCALAETIPATWSDASDLRTKWGATLGGSKLRGAKELAARLADTADFAKHETFGAACGIRQKASSAAFTEDVLKVLSQRRVEFTARYRNVIESPWLIPQDKLGSKSNAIRLDPTTCEIVPSSTKLPGE